MAYGSGLGASVGFVAESTWATYVAPTRHVPAKSFNVKKVQNTAPVSGVAAGRIGEPDEVVTTTAATGQMTADVLRKDFGLLIAHLFGSTATPVQQAATAAYLQTHTWGDNYGRSLTLQGGFPNAAGTVVPKTATGCKITQAQFSCSKDTTLEAVFDFDAKTYTEAQSLASVSYTANNITPFHFGEMAVRLGTFNSEASVQGVRSVNLTIARPMDVDRFYGGNGGAKSEQISNGMLEVSGTLEVDHVTVADFNDRFINHTSTSMVLEWVGTTAIASTYFPTISFTMPKVYFGGGLDEVSGPDVIKGSIPFKAFLDLTNGLVIAKYMSTDTAV
jgi:hypothetical protein